MERIYKAFFNSVEGFRFALRTERAVQQEAVVLAIAIPLSFVVGVGAWQRVALIASVLAIMAIELLNTCVEKLCDHVTPELHPQIRVVKDMGSAAVFCALCAAGLVWAVALAERLVWS